MPDERTVPDQSTEQADTEEAASGHSAGDAPTSEEEEAADRARQDPELSGDQEDVARHYREMTERGADAKGEGQIP